MDGAYASRGMRAMGSISRDIGSPRPSGLQLAARLPSPPEVEGDLGVA
jgi:hypothetical protein